MIKLRAMTVCFKGMRLKFVYLIIHIFSCMDNLDKDQEKIRTISHHHLRVRSASSNQTVL